MALYGPELLVKAIQQQRAKPSLTIEEEEILNAAMLANPATKKSILLAGEPLHAELGADWTSKQTPKLDETEEIREGQARTANHTPAPCANL